MITMYQVQAADDMRDRQMTFMADMIEQAAEVTAYQQHHFWTVMSLNFLASAIGLVGALFMFRGRKLGFHLYIIYCLTSIGSIFLIGPFSYGFHGVCYYSACIFRIVYLPCIVGV